ncbi:MAG: recO [Acidobacteria bacterium]|jgi:DNA repair protein RecO (recombination protein O)|nr:recO [Acidobacteriota bacterium]
MPLYKTEALVLRTYKLAEADRIVVFLTRDRGKRRGVANGARRARSRFAASLEPLTRVGMGYYEREQRELVRIGYAETILSPLAAARPDALAHVEYFAELLDEWAPEGDPNERLYRLGASALDGIAAGVPTGALARYFEYWLLRLQGVYPPHLACRACGLALDAGGEAAWLQAGADAFRCAACAGGTAEERGGVRISAAALAALAAWARTGPLALAPLAAPIERELESAHRALLARHLEKDLRSARVLRDLRR